MPLTTPAKFSPTRTTGNKNATPEAIISFGQGCEGEPALAAATIASAITLLSLKLGGGPLDDAMYSLAHPDAIDATPGVTHQTVVDELNLIGASPSVYAEKARELSVDLIIIGRHGQRGLATLLLGSVAEQLAKISDASVLLVRKH